MTHNLPASLEEAIKNNNLIPFVGAGISIGIKDKQNNPIFKSWTNSLLDAVEILTAEKENAKAMRIKSGLEIAPVDYLAIASEIHKFLASHWNKYLISTFNREYKNIDNNTLLIPQEILKINKLIITTNYDNILNWSYNNENKDLVEWDKEALYGQVKSLKENPDKQTIWYLHGKISNPDDIVFTKESYEEIYKKDSGAIKVLEHYLLTKSFIFCGFSLDDPYIKIQLEKLKSIFGTNISKHFMIIKKGQKKDFSYLGDIQFLEVEDYEDDYLALLKKINEIQITSPVKQEETSTQTNTKKQFFNVPFESKKNDVVGIEGKIEEVHSKLTQSKKLSIGQVAKFEGMGGLGKTQLAVEYAHKYKDFFKNGVLWLTMDQDLDEQLLTFAKNNSLVNQNLDIKEQLNSIKYQLKSFGNMLLIYDNTNELKDIEKDFLPKSNTNKILITTRNPIQGFESIPLETLNFENSRKLLENESGKLIPNSESIFVKELCEKLDGLPLALEMAGAYVKYLDLSWGNYLKLYNEHNIKLLDKSELPESFTKHENNIANTLTISHKIIEESKRLKEILNLLSYGANEPIDDELITKLLSCDEIDIIEAIQIGIKLKYIKKSSQGYSIHRLLKEVWKTQEKLEQKFVDNVAKNLANYIYEIKDEFLNLSILEKANLFSEQWINYLHENDTKAILIAYKAYLDFYKGDFDNGIKIVNRAHNIVEKKDSKEYAEILLYSGSLNTGLGEYKIAENLHKQSLEVYNRLFPNQDNLHIVMCLNNLGNIYHTTDNLPLSLDFTMKSFEMAKRIYSNQDHPDVARSLHNLGVYWEKIDFDKSLNFYKQSYEMYKRLFHNQDHPNFANSLNNLGGIWNIKDFNKSLKFHEQAFEMRNKLFPNQNHPDIAYSLHNLGFIWSQKDLLKSKNFFEQAFEMRKKLFSNQNHPDIISTMFNLSLCLCKNPVTRKKGLDLLRKYKRIVTKKEDKQKIENRLKKYPTIGRSKSKRKK